MNALLLVLALFAGERRTFSVRVALEGPLWGLSCDLDALGTSTFDVQLRAGERRTVDWPLPLVLPFFDENAPVPALDIAVEGAGSASVLGWAEGSTLDRLPFGLLARPVPPAPGAERPDRRPHLLLALAAVALVGLGRRRSTSVAGGLLGVGVGAWIALGSEPELAKRVVLDVDLTTNTALRSESYGPRARVAGDGELSAWPPGLELHLEVRTEGDERVVLAEARAAGERIDGANLSSRLGVSLVADGSLAHKVRSDLQETFLHTSNKT